MYTINEMILPQSTCNTDSGVKVDHLVVFDDHIDKICKKAKQRLGLILIGVFNLKMLLCLLWHLLRILGYAIYLFCGMLAVHEQPIRKLK